MIWGKFVLKIIFGWGQNFWQFFPGWIFYWENFVDVFLSPLWPQLRSLPGSSPVGGNPKQLGIFHINIFLIILRRYDNEDRKLTPPSPMYGLSQKDRGLLEGVSFSPSFKFKRIAISGTLTTRNTSLPLLPTNETNEPLFLPNWATPDSFEPPPCL